MKDVIEKLLNEVDPDIKDFMMTEQPVDRSLYPNATRGYYAYELLTDPFNAILRWQEMRDRNRVEITGKSVKAVLDE